MAASSCHSTMHELSRLRLRWEDYLRWVPEPSYDLANAKTDKCSKAESSEVLAFPSPWRKQAVRLTFFPNTITAIEPCSIRATQRGLNEGLYAPVHSHSLHSCPSTITTNDSTQQEAQDSM